MGEEKRIHFVGVGGVGLSALAQLARWDGCEVSGSDRYFDAGQASSLRKTLEEEGIRIFPQDGSGVKGADAVVVSPAVEPHIPDIVTAGEEGVRLLSRGEFLNRLTRGKKALAVAGTNGKSTTTALLSWILTENNFDPSLVLGAVLKGEGKGWGNARPGNSEWFCLEADESDGEIARYHPYLGVITNITPDHFPLPRLEELFAGFARNCGRALVSNADCLRSRKLPAARRVTFAIEAPADFRAEDISLQRDRSFFRLRGEKVELPLPGIHNLQNALAAIAAASVLDLSLKESAAALRNFPGLGRRMEVMFSGEVVVIDDYAHNPAKVEAALAAAHLMGGRVIAIYQPHGFAPLRNFLPELAAAFSRSLYPRDRLLLAPVYYAGGTTKKGIDSGDLEKEIATRAGVRTLSARDKVLTYLKENVCRNDVVLVMGARDPTLGDFARKIAEFVAPTPG